MRGSSSVRRRGSNGNGTPAVVGWLHLPQNGGMVASGILTGYGVFAEHIYERWPALAKALSDLIAAASGC
jgi:hypothetical protein